jgi:hypothetical protein
VSTPQGDRNSTPYQPTFHLAVIEFFQEQWRLAASYPAFRHLPTLRGDQFVLLTGGLLSMHSVGDFAKLPVPGDLAGIDLHHL